MKRLLTMVIVLLFIVGCGGNDAQVEPSKNLDDSQNEMDVISETGADVEPENAQMDEKLVNFKCTMGNVNEYYFYQNKIKLVTPQAEGWLLDDVYYFKMEISGKEYLIVGPTDDTEITVEEMMNMYANSKTVPDLDCTLGGVTESIVTLPDLEIITMEQMSEVMMGGMVTQ